MKRIAPMLCAVAAIAVGACSSTSSEGQHADGSHVDSLAAQHSPERFRIGAPALDEHASESLELTGEEDVDLLLQRFIAQENDARAKARFQAAVTLHFGGYPDKARALFEDALSLRNAWLPERVAIDRSAQHKFALETPPTFAQVFDLPSALGLRREVPHELGQDRAEIRLQRELDMGERPIDLADLVQTALTEIDPTLSERDLLAANASLMVVGADAEIEQVSKALDQLKAANESVTGDIFVITSRVYALDSLPPVIQGEQDRDANGDGYWDVGVLHLDADRSVLARAPGGVPDTLSAPRIAVYPWQAATLAIINQVSYTRGFDVIRTPEDHYVGDPDIGVVQDGLNLSLRAAPLHKGQVAIAFRLNASELQRPLREQEVSIGDATFRFHTPMLNRWETSFSGAMSEGSSAIAILPSQSGEQRFVAVELSISRVATPESGSDKPAPSDEESKSDGEAY